MAQGFPIESFHSRRLHCRILLLDQTGNQIPNLRPHLGLDLRCPRPHILCPCILDIELL